MKKSLKWVLRILLALLGLALVFVGIIAGAYLLMDKSNGMLVSSGEEREYLLYVPDSYDPSIPAPLVISLHGFTEWPAPQMYISRWNNLADQFKFMVVYPSGTRFPKRWEATLAPGAETNPDITFIADLIKELERQYNIDPDRIYANGLSNGGGMTFLLACSLSDQIAAIGTVAGAYMLPWSECLGKRPVPAVVFHGTEDPIVPYLGNPGNERHGALPNIPDWVEHLASRNGCSPEGVDMTPAGTVKGVYYENCTTRSDVVFYTITGGGHTWPGGEPLPEFITGITSQDIDATRVMWEFFQDHPLNGE